MSTKTLLVDLRCVGKEPRGSACYRPVVVVLGGLPMCGGHRRRVVEDVKANELPPPPLITEAPAVVYYIGDPERQLVKIGTTTALRKRMRSIRMLRRSVILLATEPGGYGIEASRHHQFRATQEITPSGEREWFRKTPVLMQHIAEVRSTYGILCPGQPIHPRWVASVRRPVAC